MGEVINIEAGRPNQSSSELETTNKKIAFNQKAVQDLLKVIANPANDPERKKNEQELAVYLRNLTVLVEQRNRLQQSGS